MTRLAPPIPIARLSLVRPAVPVLAVAVFGAAVSGAVPVHAAERAGWSVVPHVGTSLLGDQSPDVAGAEGIADGALDIGVDAGFAAGVGLRRDFAGSPWGAELGWEYRTNDVTTTAADGAALPGGNYASNTFYLNGRYVLVDDRPLYTPWIGAGLTYTQEIDLDIEGVGFGRSFADAGATGFQLMAGADIDLSERLYLSGELRYSSRTGLDLAGEGAGGRVSNIDYETLTLGLGLGVRF